MFQYRLAEPASDELLKTLKTAYAVDLFTEFPKPFFRASKKQHLLITGAFGLDDITVIFKKDCPLSEKKKLEKLLKPFILPLDKRKNG